MKKVFIVCGKLDKESYNFWITVIVTSKKKAENWVKELDKENPDYYHYYFEEPVF